MPISPSRQKRQKGFLSPRSQRMPMSLSRLAVSREGCCPQADESGHVPRQADILSLSSQKSPMSLIRHE